MHSHEKNDEPGDFGDILFIHISDFPLNVIEWYQEIALKYQISPGNYHPEISGFTNFFPSVDESSRRGRCKPASMKMECSNPLFQEDSTQKTLGFSAENPPLGRGVVGQYSWVLASKNINESLKELHYYQHCPRLDATTFSRRSWPHPGNLYIFCVWMQREYVQQPALERRGCISCNDDGTLGGGMYPKVSVCMYMYIHIDKYIHILHGRIFSFSMAYLDPNTSYISSVSVVPTKTSKNHGWELSFRWSQGHIRRWKFRRGLPTSAGLFGSTALTPPFFPDVGPTILIPSAPWNIYQYCTMWGLQTIANLVFNCNTYGLWYLWFMVLLTIVSGLCKPTNI